MFFHIRIFKNKKNASEDEIHPNFEIIDLSKEQDARKQWLLSFFITIAFSIFINLFQSMKYSEADEHFFLRFVISTLAEIPWILITYYCSYKKRGTAWLMFTMILSLISLGVVLTLEVFQTIGQISDGNSLGWPLFITYLGLLVYYYINCFRLYMVNSNRKDHEVQYLKEKFYKEISASGLDMEKAENINHLNSIFYYVIEKWPRWEKELSTRYKIRKAWLEKICLRNLKLDFRNLFEYSK